MPLTNTLSYFITNRARHLLLEAVGDVIDEEGGRRRPLPTRAAWSTSHWRAVCRAGGARSCCGGDRSTHNHGGGGKWRRRNSAAMRVLSDYFPDIGVIMPTWLDEEGPTWVRVSSLLPGTFLRPDASPRPAWSTSPHNSLTMLWRAKDQHPTLQRSDSPWTSHLRCLSVTTGHEPSAAKSPPYVQL